MRTTLTALLLAAAPAAVRADESYARVVEQVNQKLCKLFGSGGLQRLASYGTGVVVSPDGYVLTVASYLLDTQDLRVHLYDGSRYHARVVAVEPELDVALVKVGDAREKIQDLPYFDVMEAAKRPLVEPGTHVLAFSNQFQIALRDEPMSVQHGVVAAYARLHGRSGIFEASYKGNVYVLDAITNNPGAGGGVITTRKGQFLGLIGKELHNELTNTWINYAVPIGARVEVRQPDGKVAAVALLDLVTKKERYKPLDVARKGANAGGGYDGIILVPNPVERTPPYVEEVVPQSPAARAGLKPDDLIVYVDGLPAVSIDSYRELLGRYRPGDEVKLEVRRGDKLITIALKLAEPPARPSA
jgi:serine protease Do